MSKSNVITLQGKDFTTYEGLLDLAHQEGLCRISTTIVQIPTQDNGNMAVVMAEVETGKGTFSGIGDANPGNVNRMILPHVLRMAETRAKARALRDAVNVGVTSVEEMSDSPEHGHDTGETVREERARPAESKYEQKRGGNVPTESETKRDSNGVRLATKNQLESITKISRLLGEPEEPAADMTFDDASDRIRDLSAEFNQRKADPARRG